MSAEVMGPAIDQRAPEFELRSQHGETVALSAYRGVSNVLLVFFPFAFSRICTGELTEIRDHAEMFSSHDTEVLAISCDPMYALRAYADSDRLYFSLLSDFWPHGLVANAYGVLDDQVGAAVRGSFLIDRQGVLRWSVVNGLGEARNLGAYADAMAAL